MDRSERVKEKKKKKKKSKAVVYMALVPVGLCNGVATLEDTLEIPQILNIVLFM
jgi:hypothetical protein